MSTELDDPYTCDICNEHLPDGGGRCPDCRTYRDRWVAGEHVCDLLREADAEIAALRERLRNAR